MSDDDVMTDDYNFAEGEDVFVYFNDLLYEAKCMKRRKTEYGENQYFIHYKGWKSSWDEWIDENEVLEMSSTNYGHQARLQMKFDEKRALEESKKKKKIEKPKKKNEKPKKNISVPSMLKKRGRPRKTVTINKSSNSIKNNKEPTTTLAVKTTSQTNKNLQKRGKSKKAEPKSNTTDKKVKDKTKVINNDTITKSAPSSSGVVSSSTPRSSTMASSSTASCSTMARSSTPRSSTMASSSTASCSTMASSSTPSSSTVTSSSETMKTVKTYSNKTKKLINEVKENISVTEPSQSSNIDYCNEFQPEYEPVLKRLKTYTKNKFPETLQVNASNVSDDATKNIGKQIAEKALNFEIPSQSININNCKLSNDAAISNSVPSLITKPNQFISMDNCRIFSDTIPSSSVQSLITEPNKHISINNCRLFNDTIASGSVQSLITEPNKHISIDNCKVSNAAISNSVQSLITEPDQPINIDNCKVSNDATASGSVQSLITEPTQPINTDNCKVSNDATASGSVQSLITEPNQPITKDNTTTENDKEKSAEEEAAIRAASNIYLNIIPFAMRLGDKLHQSMLLPHKLKKVMLDDWLVHNSNQKLYKFQDVHYVANVAHTFTEELYRFANDSDKKTSMMLCVKFMECFNNIIHTHITFKSEIKNAIQFKAMSYFRKRLIDYPNITYVLKEHIVPKKIWCYVYGPMYLLRFIARLPFVVLTTSWNVECDIDFFVDYVNKMIRFLDDNFNTYFSSIDFIEY